MIKVLPKSPKIPCCTNINNNTVNQVPTIIFITLSTYSSSVNQVPKIIFITLSTYSSSAVLFTTSGDCNAKTMSPELIVGSIEAPIHCLTYLKSKVILVIIKCDKMVL